MHGNPNNCDGPPDKYEMRVRLTIQKGRAKSLVRKVDGPVFTLGTDHSCDMVLGDPQFPDVHSYVCIRDTVVSLRHLGQGPTVTVNGREVRWGELRDGDRIRTGSYEFRIRIERRLAAKFTPEPHGNTPKNIAFAGTLDQLPSWWTAVTDMPVDWGSIAANMSLRDGRFGSQNN